MLTIKKIEALKPADKDYKQADAGGLYLKVLKSGAKSWRHDYKDGEGKYKTKTFGVYPAVTLAQAREALVAFKNPPVEVAPLGPTFEVVARAFLKIKLPALSNHKHQGQFVGTLERHVFPSIGAVPIGVITRRQLVELLRAVDAAGITETAHRVAGRIGMVFSYAQDAGIIDVHMATGLSRVLRSRRTKAHMPSVLPIDAPPLLRDISTYGEPVTRLGLLLAAHTFVRGTELRLATWSEFDLVNKVWVVDAARMKLRRPHVVPLSRQVLALLDELREVNGHGQFILDSPERPGKPISENTLLFALYRLGWRGRMTVHGFRALASGVLNEQSGFSADAIERQLAHKETDAVRAAYHRAAYVDQRVEMMQWWSDWLDAQLASFD